MKKLLALVLALVMSLSLVTISNAAFKDADSIDNKEAVEVMNAVGVLIGDEKGNFNAKDTLTRAQAAKIIAYLDLGGKTADAIKGTGTVFSDVKATDWFAGFVEYCAGAGYVAGVGDKKFAPNEKVTGVQFAKMLLCALGYSAEIEGYTGTDYTISVARDANKNELFNALSIVTSANLTREQAAQMAFNALKATCVEYQGGTKVSTSDGTNVVVNAVRNEVTTSVTHYDRSATPADNKLQLAEKLYGTDLKLYHSSSTEDAFKRSCNQWTYKADEVGKYPAGADYTLTGEVTQAKLYATVGSTVVDAIKDTAKPLAQLTVYTDGVSESIASNFVIGEKNSQAIPGTGNASVTEVYVDTDTNAVKLVTINTYVVQATDDYSAKKESVTVSNVGEGTIATSSLTLSAKDFAVTDVKEDDYLLVTVANGEIKSVKPATIVTGTVSTFDSGKSVTIDGTKYSYAKFARAQSDANSKTVQYKVGEKANVVTDGTYIYYVDKAKVGTDTYVFIKELKAPSGLTTGNKVADAYFLDGTNATITVKSKDSDDTSIGDIAVGAGKWYKYSVKDGVYTLETLTSSLNADTTTNGDGVKLTETGKIVIGTGVNATRGNSATTFVVVNSKDNVTVYTGIANAPTVAQVGSASTNAVKAYYLKDSDNTAYAKYVFIDVEETGASIKNATTSASDSIYVLKCKNTNGYWDAKGDKVYAYEVLVNGEKTEITSTIASLEIYNLYTDIGYNKDGYLDSVTKITSTNATANDSVYYVGNDVDIKVAKDVLTFDGTTDFDKVVAKDAKIFMIASKVDSAALLDDANATYEVTEVSLNTLNNLLKGYNGTAKTLGVFVTGTVDKDNDTVKSLYVYVTAAV